MNIFFTDGYNGSWTVDLVDQYILTNMYFDHLETLQSIFSNSFIFTKSYFKHKM